MSQLSMFGGPLPTKEQLRQERRQEKAALAKRFNKRPTIDERFAAFHAANPHVFDEMKRLATARLNRGETRIAVKALWEELRSALIKIDDGDGPPAPKLDNSYTALYARMLVQYPVFEKAIEVRKRKAER